MKNYFRGLRIKVKKDKNFPDRDFLLRRLFKGKLGFTLEEHEKFLEAIDKFDNWLDV